MSAKTSNSDTPKSDSSKIGKDTTVSNTIENLSSAPESASFAAHGSLPGPVVPLETTELKEEGTLEERLAKAKELNN